MGEIARGVIETPEAIARKTGKNFAAGRALAESGVQDLRNGNVLPSFPSSDPRSWEAGGALKVPFGGAAALLSPFSAASNRLIGEPVTERSPAIPAPEKRQNCWPVALA